MSLSYSRILLHTVLQNCATISEYWYLNRPTTVLGREHQAQPDNMKGVNVQSINVADQESQIRHDGIQNLRFFIIITNFFFNLLIWKNTII